MMLFLTTLIILIILSISLLIMMISSILAKKTIPDREKNSPFECGFDPNGSARLPFSLRFFLIAVIFMIFDVEITLLLPLAPILHYTYMKTLILTSASFLGLLLVGLYHEWNQGALEWAL